MEYWIYVCKKNEKRKKQNTGKSDIANPKEQRCRISQNVLETWPLSSAKEHLL